LIEPLILEAASTIFSTGSLTASTIFSTGSLTASMTFSTGSYTASMTFSTGSLTVSIIFSTGTSTCSMISSTAFRLSMSYIISPSDCITGSPGFLTGSSKAFAKVFFIGSTIDAILSATAS
jgi:hypothetical protein